MKYFIVLALFAAVAVALPVDSKDAEIESYVYENDIDKYNYGFKTSDGKVAEESGSLKNVGTENEALVVRGSFSYVGSDGVTYTVTYVSDENGFQPQGAHLPVGPQ